MFCPNCGAQIPDGSQVCMQCGTTIPANIQPMQPQGAIPQPMQSQPVQPQPMQPNAGVQQPGFGSQPAYGSVQASYTPPSNYAPMQSQPIQPQPMQPNAGVQQPGFNSQPAYGSAQPSYIPSQPMQPQGVIPQPMQSQPQPMQPNAGVQQPGFNSQPAYGSVQPSYIPPSNYAPFTQVKKSKTPIIVACCAAVVVVAVVLIIVLIPKSNGRGPLEHRWSATQNGYTMIFDFKDNKATLTGMGDRNEYPMEWKEKGNNRISITDLSKSQTEYFTYELSSDGNTLTLTDDYGDTIVLTRVD